MPPGHEPSDGYGLTSRSDLRDGALASSYHEVVARHRVSLDSGWAIPIPPEAPGDVTDRYHGGRTGTHPFFVD